MSPRAIGCPSAVTVATEKGIEPEGPLNQTVIDPEPVPSTRISKRPSESVVAVTVPRPSGHVNATWVPTMSTAGPEVASRTRPVIEVTTAGVVVVEVVFVYPGMGQYMVDAVTVRDMPVVQACGLIFAAVYILLNMTADIIAIVSNPRLRHPR